MKNKSFTYLLPLYCKFLCQENPELEEILFITFLEECYSYHKVNDQLENYFILQLKRPENRNEIFVKLLHNLKKSSIFADINETDDCLNIFLRIPDKIKPTYNKFVKGQYSKINNKDKITILSFAKEHFSVEFSVKINQVFSKSSQMREELEEKLGMKIPEDIELSSVPNMLSETF